MQKVILIIHIFVFLSQLALDNIHTLSREPTNA